jgi:hypothetical protein
MGMIDETRKLAQEATHEILRSERQTGGVIMAQVMKRYLGRDGERHSLHTIFKFDDLDDDLCGKHQCGYTADTAIFIETSILPDNWKIRTAPKQLPIGKFAKPMSSLRNLAPLDLPTSDVALRPWAICYVGSDVVLDNKYVLLLEHLGCTLRYQKRERTGEWITNALSIEKDGRIVGLLMPMNL